ncbi:MAG: hypothetical protein KDA78_05380 [Planctomycetaceae bacterium]|nr:hypothetical protein [Planctomycetaceae bacterium]
MRIARELAITGLQMTSPAMLFEQDETMWPFGGKDWNVIGIMFEKTDSYSVNGNRAKGKMADSVKTRVKIHDRTIMWVVFDQKGGIVESGPGNGVHHVSNDIYKNLEKVLHTNVSIREILKMLEQGTTAKAAKKLIWSGYPAKRPVDDE